MLVLPGTLTLKVKSINSNWSITGLSGSLPTDSEIHLALVTCYNTSTDAVLKTNVKMRMMYKIENENIYLLLKRRPT